VNTSWKIAAASVTGRSHRSAAIPCQDASAFRTRGPAIAAVVTDGAGSARLSHLGAPAVAGAVADWLVDNASALLAGRAGAAEIIAAARAAIERQVAEHGGEPRDYACTLVGLLLKGEQGAAVHLGDGAIAAVRGGEPRLVSGPDNGEFANETVFVTSSRAQASLRVTRFHMDPGVTSFALMTDGAQASLLDRRTGRVSRVVEQVAAWLDTGSEEAVSANLARNIETYLVPRTTDDCTLLVLRRAQQSAWPPARPACARCGSDQFRRGRGGKTRFTICCARCGTVHVRSRSRGRAYPPAARQWAAHLRSQGLTCSQVHRLTGLPRRTLRRWAREADDKA